MCHELMQSQRKKNQLKFYNGNRSLVPCELLSYGSVNLYNSIYTKGYGLLGTREVLHYPETKNNTGIGWEGSVPENRVT